MNKVSVLMAIYLHDCPEKLFRSMDSIYLQALPPNEIVVVCDGPVTDQLDKVLRHWAELFAERLKVVRLEQNAGLGAALNRGLRACTDTWVARMDADDVMMQDRLLLQMNHLERHPEIDVLGGWAIDIDGVGTRRGERRVPTSHGDIVRWIWTCPIIHPTVVYRREAIMRIGGYSVTTRRAEDYDLWFRAVEHGLIFENLPTSLLLYHVAAPNDALRTLRQGLSRVMVGWRGCWRLNAPLTAYLGVTVHLFKAMLPEPARGRVMDWLRRVDPRTKK